MHRSYQSILPCQNKFLQMRWDKNYYEEHRRKVKDAAPMVNTRAPVTYMHLHLRLKKLQLEEERLATIERDNRILLEKMSNIMRTRGRVDNINNYDFKSLNREKRQRELLRVTRENQGILRRILVKEAEYSQEKWQREWEDNQQLLDNISHYPQDWWILKPKGKKSKDRKDGTARKSADISSQDGRQSEPKSAIKSEEDSLRFESSVMQDNAEKTNDHAEVAADNKAEKADLRKKSASKKVRKNRKGDKNDKPDQKNDEAKEANRDDLSKSDNIAGDLTKENNE